MNFRNVEASYGAVEELEWPETWDQYERAVRSFEDAHVRPCEVFGISEESGGPLIHQLRILDTGGEYIASLQHWQSAVHKAEDGLKRLLTRLPKDWYSAKVLDRITRLLDLEQCHIRPVLIQSLQSMRVDNDKLADLQALAKTRNGFDQAINAIERVGTREALESLSKIAGSFAGQPDSVSKARRLGRLNDAAVAISVQLKEPKVIPLLVNRLTATYANSSGADSPMPGDSPMAGDLLMVGKDSHRHAAVNAIIEQLMTVINASSERLHEKLLVQLAGLGLVDLPDDDVKQRHLENPHLGVEQAMITRDLLPVRTAARRELERRKIAS